MKLNRCRLCLLNAEDAIEIYNDEGKDLIIAAISQHFWFEVQKDDLSFLHVCKKCWTDTINFHSFYHRIKENHLHDVVVVPKEEEEIKDEFSDSNGSFNNMENSMIFEQIFTCLDKENPDPVKSEDLDQSEAKAGKKTKVNISKNKRKPLKKEPAAEKETSEEDQLAEASLKIYCDMRCQICKTNLASWNDVKSHFRAKHKIPGYVICCERKFNKKIRLLEHISYHLNPEAFKCEKCNKLYSSKENLTKHKVLHFPIELRPHKCDECSKTFSKTYLLTAHKKNDHLKKQDEKLACKECSKMFISNKYLQAHIKGIHRNAFVHVCEVCAKSFRTKINYQVHKKLHSVVERPKIQCTKCGKWFKSDQSILSHMRRHQQENNIYKCETCGKISPNKAALQSHKKYVHLLERSFKCSVCEKAFKKPIELREHMAGHTGEVLYQCPAPDCNKSYNSNANMLSHKKKAHKTYWEEEKKRKMM